MKELINQISDKISHFETNSSEQLAVKTIYQIKMLTLLNSEYFLLGFIIMANITIS